MCLCLYAMVVVKSACVCVWGRLLEYALMRTHTTCTSPTQSHPSAHQHTTQTQAAALHALAKVLRGEAIDPDAPTWQPHPPSTVYAAVADAMDVGAPEETGGQEGGNFTQAERWVCIGRECVTVRLRGSV